LRRPNCKNVAERGFDHHAALELNLAFAGPLWSMYANSDPSLFPSLTCTNPTGARRILLWDKLAPEASWGFISLGYLSQRQRCRARSCEHPEGWLTCCSFVVISTLCSQADTQFQLAMVSGTKLPVSHAFTKKS
jgi:hypothetical protein